MARKVPNINKSNILQKRDRLAFKQFVLDVNIDTFIYSFSPNYINLDESGQLFTLYLLNKKFNIDILEIDSVKDYIDVYLFGVKQPQDRYDIGVDENNIEVIFLVPITLAPASVVATDFELKGKISDIL
jgi:hypothetical protein